MKNKYSRKAVKKIKLDVDAFLCALNCKCTFKHNEPTQHCLQEFEVLDLEISIVTQTGNETESTLEKQWFS